MIIGDKRTFAFEIEGENPSTPQLRVVRIWLVDQLLTRVDDVTYVPAFTHALKRDLAWMVAPDQKSSKSIFGYGPTTDDVSASAVMEGESISFRVMLSSTVSLVAKLNRSSMVETYEHAIIELQNASA